MLIVNLSTLKMNTLIKNKMLIECKIIVIKIKLKKVIPLLTHYNNHHLFF